MARTTAPLFSLDASGTIGDAIVFSRWRGRSYVRRHVIPANPRSGLQVGLRSVFQYTTQAWAGLSAAIKDAWEAVARTDNITGLNAQVRVNQDLARRNLGWVKEPDAAPITSPDAPTAPTTVAQPKTLVLSWTRPVANQGDYTAAVYLFTSTGFSEDISNLVAVVDVATLTVTITGLTTGQAYFWTVRETTSDGKLGTLSAEGTGTPT